MPIMGQRVSTMSAVSRFPRPERGGVDAIPDERLVADRRADAPHALEWEAQAALGITSPAVVAMVVERAEELGGARIAEDRGHAVLSEQLESGLADRRQLWFRSWSGAATGSLPASPAIGVIASEARGEQCPSPA